MSLLTAFVVAFFVVLGACAVLGGYARLSTRVRALAGLALVSLIPCTLPAVADPLLYALESEYARPTALPGPDTGGRRYVLVLSGGTMRATLQGQELKIGANGWERLAAGVRVSKEAGAILILSGGDPERTGNGSLGELMARTAEHFGVPRARMLVETAARNTYENLAFSQHRFALTERDTVLLVTSAAHMPRTMATARHLGLRAIAWPTDYLADERLGWLALLPNSRAVLKFSIVAHERIGMLIYRLRGWA